jgi:anti-anti-sigma factor
VTEPLADIRFEPADGIVVAHLQGEVDMSNAHELGAAIAAELGNAAMGVVIDLTEVTYLDSAGIHVVYELRERIQRRGQDIRLVVAPESPIETALDYADVPRTIGVAHSVEAALADLGTDGMSRG